MVELTRPEFVAALERGRMEMATTPHAASARYDHVTDRIVIDLTNRCTFMFPPRLAQGLEAATPEQLAEIEISPAGASLHWPALDVDFSVSGLVAGVFGTRGYLARRAGQTSSTAKAAAARENGKKGGRPRRSAAS